MTAPRLRLHGRPHQVGNGMPRASYRLGRTLLYRLDQASRELHVARSSIVRQAISDWIRAHEKTRTQL